ncbi:MAG: sodium:solute symporter [Phaeodactylibacter sp.]|nr:sodium:solute symporter [Phaeodactylibacter sp.]MCB9275367.1 sodium:solute symporter [Lewinellaceae bacterium]
MSTLDWIVMLSTLLGIVVYGVWKTRHINTVQSYLLGDNDLPWWTIGLSVMATQASAITFLSTPGQAYEDGMRFAQFYFGLPVAMVILCIFVLPYYYRLRVYTAYEYLEGRFDLKTRTLTAILFLIQRGLAAGLTIYAPAIILSTILGWSLNWTILFIGLMVVVYTVAGGTKAVSMTQKQQMVIILSGMFIAAIILVYKLPGHISFGDAVGVAGKMGKLNVVDFNFDLSNRYNFWSGMLGGVFLFLSYFGTDQSQVSRYLGGKSLAESRLGLLFNGILKVPMQFLILFVGILVFMFFQFHQPPIHFNRANLEKLEGTQYQSRLENLQSQHNTLFLQQQQEVSYMIGAIRQDNDAAIQQSKQRVQELMATGQQLRDEVKELILQADPVAKARDTDYVFITFVMEYLPIGLVGLLLAVIFSAAMSSTSSELNALATTTVVDIYRRSLVRDKSDGHYLRASKMFTLFWGGVAMLFAATAGLFENLIQAVNIIGSLFYGSILGIFLVAFFMKKVGAHAVFIGALIAEALVLLIYWTSNNDFWFLIGDTWYAFKVAYLWLNLIGCVLVMGIAGVLHGIIKQ